MVNWILLRLSRFSIARTAIQRRKVRADIRAVQAQIDKIHESYRSSYEGLKGDDWESIAAEEDYATRPLVEKRDNLQYFLEVAPLERAAVRKGLEIPNDWYSFDSETGSRAIVWTKRAALARLLRHERLVVFRAWVDPIIAVL